MSGATIARTCQVTPQTLQAMLTRAEREGWITRDISEVNHRILTASLTRKGEVALGTRPGHCGRDRREDLDRRLERTPWISSTPRLNTASRTCAVRSRHIARQADSART